MRTTGFGLSALLIAGGAILAWAVTYEAEGVDLNQVGIILFIVGLGLAAVTLILAAMGRRTTIDSSREDLVGGQPLLHREREVITDRDAQP